jgi:hypothetical protein
MQLVAMLQQQDPNLNEDTALHPELKPAMYARVVAELPGQSIPLATAAQLINNAVEALPPIDHLAAGFLARPELLQDRFDQRPQAIVDFPNRVQHLRFRSHRAPPCHENAINTKSSNLAKEQF